MLPLRAMKRYDNVTINMDEGPQSTPQSGSRGTQISAHPQI